MNKKKPGRPRKAEQNDKPESAEWRFTLRAPYSLKDLLDQYCEVNRRTLNNAINVLLEAALRDRGFTEVERGPQDKS